MKINIFILILALLPFYSCNSQSQTTNSTSDTIVEENDFDEEIAEDEYALKFDCDEFSREKIKQNIEIKIKAGLPLFVHIFVPLCDNENQGIVPTSKKLGDGMNLNTNLYWGAGYGMRTHFKRKKEWKLLATEKNITKDILERLIFVKVFPNKTKVFLCMDAYRGDRMKECLDDYFLALSAKSNETYISGNDTVGIKSNADFLIFNGHDGLMDTEVNWVKNETEIYKDAAVISCVSYEFFAERFKCTKTYPLVTTICLLGVEAYTAHGIIDAWATQKNDEKIRLSAGDAMYGIFKGNRKAYRNMFKTGW